MVPLTDSIIGTEKERMHGRTVKQAGVRLMTQHHKRFLVPLADHGYCWIYLESQPLNLSKFMASMMFWKKGNIRERHWLMSYIATGGGVKWANENSSHFFFDIDEVVEERKRDIRTLYPDDVLTFGKYKGESIKQIADKDMHYLMWLADNSEDIIISFEGLDI